MCFLKLPHCRSLLIILLSWADCRVLEVFDLSALIFNLENLKSLPLSFILLSLILLSLYLELFLMDSNADPETDRSFFALSFFLKSTTDICSFYFI